MPIVLFTRVIDSRAGGAIFHHQKYLFLVAKLWLI